LTDIVVEFGNALHQDIADRFILEGKPVADADLQKIWRHTIGGNVLWDAPVYAQFFRSVRAVNALRPPKQRLRVLLGDPPSITGRSGEARTGSISIRCKHSATHTTRAGWNGKCFRRDAAPC
jgi:hypothetical protein